MNSKVGDDEKEGQVVSENEAAESGILRTTVSAEELASFDWEQEFASFDGVHSRWGHVTRLRQRAEELSADEKAQAATLRLLSAVVSMHMMVGTATLFGPALQMSTGRSAAPEDLDERDLAALTEMAGLAKSPWLRARLADVGLVVSQSHGRPSWQLGVIAARSYLDHARTEGVHAIDRRESLQRAMELGWRYLRRDDHFRSDLWATAMTLLRKGLAENAPGVSVPLAHEISRRNRGLAAEAAELFEERAEQIAAEGANPLAADTFREAAALWNTAKEEEKSRAAHHRTADMFIALARGPGQAMLQADWMAEGIAILRRHRGERSTIRELQAELTEIRTRIIGEMGTISHPIDVSQIVAHVERRMTADNLPEALLQLAFAFSDWTSAARTRVEVIEAAQRYVLSNFFRRVTYSADGVPVDVTAPFDASNEEELERRIVQHVVQFEHPLLAQVAITKGIDIMQSKFEPTMADMAGLLHQSPVVPRGHEWSLARGLLAGLNYDWNEAAIFLIPQAEPFVRAAFHRRGIHTLSHNTTTDGVEEEKSLNELLVHPEVETVLSPDIVLELKAQLTHKSGHNLRNRYGHGLITDDNLACVGTIVLWWTMLRLVLWPYRGRALELIRQAEKVGPPPPRGKDAEASY